MVKPREGEPPATWARSTDRMVRIGGTWLRSSAVIAVEPYAYRGEGHSRVWLTGGAYVVVEATPDATANALWETT